jgi:hypothetical protein
MGTNPSSREGPRLTGLGKFVILLFIAACVAGAYYLFTGKHALEETRRRASSLLGSLCGNFT